MERNVTYEYDESNEFMDDFLPVIHEEIAMIDQEKKRVHGSLPKFDFNFSDDQITEKNSSPHQMQKRVSKFEDRESMLKTIHMDPNDIGIIALRKKLEIAKRQFGRKMDTMTPQDLIKNWFSIIFACLVGFLLHYNVREIKPELYSIYWSFWWGFWCFSFITTTLLSGKDLTIKNRKYIYYLFLIAVPCLHALIMKLFRDPDGKIINKLICGSWSLFFIFCLPPILLKLLEFPIDWLVKYSLLMFGIKAVTIYLFILLGTKSITYKASMAQNIVTFSPFISVIYLKIMMKIIDKKLDHTHFTHATMILIGTSHCIPESFELAAFIYLIRHHDSLFSIILNICSRIFCDIIFSSFLWSTYISPFIYKYIPIGIFYVRLQSLELFPICNNTVILINTYLPLAVIVQNVINQKNFENSTLIMACLLNLFITSASLLIVNSVGSYFDFKGLYFIPQTTRLNCVMMVFMVTLINMVMFYQFEEIQSQT